MHLSPQSRRVPPVRNRAAAACVVVIVLGAARLTAEPGLATLDATLGQIVRATKGEIGVALLHVESGAELFSFNGSRPFAMASVYKRPIAFEALAQVAERRLAFDQLVVIRPSDIRDCCALSRRHPQTAAVVNDVGIITLPDNGGHLALSVFVMNGAGASATQEAIARIAAAAYEAFTGKPIPPPPGKAKPARRSARDAGS